MTATEPEAEVVADGVPVTIDGVEILANKGELLIAAAERHGVYIPRFCYHPRMKPVGMCRMCLVEVDTGRGPGLQPSCMLPVSDGMTVLTESDVTKKAQDGVLEFLLINHPLDCPVCDKGGECPLQDQTMAFGPGESRFVEEKRHFKKPIPISDIVYLDRERCILCDRCTRFASEVAGDPLIHFQARGNQTEVNTFPDEPFSSYFSGNTVQICPVGALTAKPYRFKARPWDLSEIASTATLDAVGSRITVQSSRNQVLRYLGVDSDPVNWGWLSDKERFSFEAWNSDARLTQPLLRGDSLGNPTDEGDQLVAGSWALALTKVAEALDGVEPERIAVFGGARMTNEGQYAWAKLIKSVLRTDNVDAQLGDGAGGKALLSLPRTTIDAACTPGGTVVVLGADPKETHGSLFLRLRHAAENDGASIIEIAPRSSGLAPYATSSLYPVPGELDQLVDALGDPFGDAAGVDGDDIAAVSERLRNEESFTVVVGSGSLGDSPAVIERAVLRMAALFPNASFLPALHRGNVMGALDMGLAPGLLPGRQAVGPEAPGTWANTPAMEGLDTTAMLHLAEEGGIDVAILLGCDPLTDFPDAGLAERGFNKVSHLVAVDSLLNFTSTGADIVFPAAASATEVDGTFTNIEGRLSPISRKVTPPGTARADWMIAVEIAAQLGVDLGFIDIDELWADLAAASPLHSGVALGDVMAADTDGVLLTGTSIDSVEPPAVDVPNSSDLRLVVTRKMYDEGTILTHCPSLNQLAAGASASVNPTHFSALGFSEGDEVKVTSQSGSVTVPVISDPGVPAGAVAIEFNQPNASAASLLDSARTVTTVSLERVS
ncbi:MAG: NADH dehydrogenase (quinone) subunit G [Acidimicrobiales bacterium]|nr:MAG: NADH dehydrogenase (quinone) subunit G [Acidimicrobiales bacterium]